MRRCKTIDARLARLPDTLAQHSEAARSMTRGLALMQDARQQLAALRAEADGLQPALLALTRLYGELAAIGPAPTADLERQEAAHRQMRSSHYQQLQRALDAQYADAIRDAAQQRAETAARSFQRDLDSFRRGQAVRPRPGKFPGDTKPRRPRALSLITAITLWRLVAARAADLASIVLPASSPHDMDDFFSDVSAKVGPPPLWPRRIRKVPPC
ncbi:hypothetical protein IWW54_006267 [Coemansia sp. RSA 2705]|nr:hypothetical protein IWW54_006267 [Coemansia sp. RSA 2705]